MRGVSSAAALLPFSEEEVAETCDVSESIEARDLTDPVHLFGLGGGRSIDEPLKGEPKKALVFLPIECTDTEGEGRGEGADAEVIDEEDVRTLRWDERVEELSVDGEGLR